jgi:hypothetical protein
MLDILEIFTQSFFYSELNDFATPNLSILL